MYICDNKEILILLQWPYMHESHWSLIELCSLEINYKSRLKMVAPTWWSGWFQSDTVWGTAAHYFFLLLLCEESRWEPAHSFTAGLFHMRAPGIMASAWLRGNATRNCDNTCLSLPECTAVLGRIRPWSGLGPVWALPLFTAGWGLCTGQKNLYPLSKLVIAVYYCHIITLSF